MLYIWPDGNRKANGNRIQQVRFVSWSMWEIERNRYGRNRSPIKRNRSGTTRGCNDCCGISLMNQCVVFLLILFGNKAEARRKTARSVKLSCILQCTPEVISLPCHYIYIYDSMVNGNKIIYYIFGRMVIQLMAIEWTAVEYHIFDPCVKIILR